MSDEALAALIDLFPEAIVLARVDATVLATNQAARQLLPLAPRPLEQQTISDWITDPPRKLRDYLRTCARNRALVPIGLNLVCAAGLAGTACVVEGAAVQPRTSARQPVLLLRWRTRAQSARKFVELNQRVDHLAREMHQRLKAAEEQRRHDQKLQQAQKLESLTLMAGGVAHTFNNLMTAVLGHAELAVDKLDPDSPVQKDLQQILQAGQRAANLASQMLTYSGAAAFDTRIVDINSLIRGMADLLTASISSQIGLLFNLSDLPTTAEVDPTQIRQVLMNLITNASEAIGDSNGSIRIQTSLVCVDKDDPSNDILEKGLAEGWYVRLEVTDTGSGMSPEVQARLFDPFFSTKFTGRGLGLAAAMGIVRVHRGVIRVSSPPGRGTRFTVMLPHAETGR